VRSEHGRAMNETQKPLGIITPLLLYACPDGGTVLDPFSGAGSTLLCARMLGLKAIGIELRESQCECTVQRFRQIQFEWEPAVAIVKSDAAYGALEDNPYPAADALIMEK
jgi:tRNA G10  N-methylase Trm11